MNIRDPLPSLPHAVLAGMPGLSRLEIYRTIIAHTEAGVIEREEAASLIVALLPRRCPPVAYASRLRGIIDAYRARGIDLIRPPAPADATDDTP